MKDQFLNYDKIKDVFELISSTKDNSDSEDFFKHMKKWNSASLMLQKDYLDLGDEQCLFDVITEQCPMMSNLFARDAEIKHLKHFEKGVVKN